MLVTLTPIQARIIGVMLEKETTTPDQYPLTLNSLTSGCNQKSNREPVMNLSETDVQNALDELAEMRQVSNYTGAGSRVAKYTHRFCNTEFGSLKLSKQQRAIVCVLLLRGPQTPGELRTRTNRLAEFANVDEVEAVLQDMQSLNGEQLVAKLEREPGKRESRYAHLFSELDAQASLTAATVSADPLHRGQSESETANASDRIDHLERQVCELQVQVKELQELVEILSQ